MACDRGVTYTCRNNIYEYTDGDSGCGDGGCGCGGGGDIDGGGGGECDGVVDGGGDSPVSYAFLRNSRRLTL